MAQEKEKKKNPSHMTQRWAARDTVKGTETAAQHGTHDYNMQKQVIISS